MVLPSIMSERAIMHIAFGVFAWVFLRVRRKIALLQATPFGGGQFIARQLPKIF